MANAQPTSAPTVQGEGEQKPLAQEPQPPMSDAPAFQSAPPLPAGHSIISKEEKVEYRDQDGNLLDPEQVKLLEGKVSFKTRYETRTRLVDAAGNEIQPDIVGVAPPHPDVDNVDQETIGIPEKAGDEGPASQRDVTADEKKEEGIENTRSSLAKPASEGNEATA